ncbi:MAG TPA: hypothetical protein VGL84_09380 [Gaiellaceae bacterium]|jgi:hypothetical protein
MTDVLAERFAAFVNTTDDGDWLDVQRRARRSRRRFLVSAVLVATAVCATAAFAANSWLFPRTPDSVTAITHVQFHNASWRIYLTVTPDRAFCATLTRGDARRTPGGCNIWVKPIPLIVRSTNSFHIQLATPPFDGLRHVDGRGELWYGVAQGNVARISITDANGHVTSTETVSAPKTTRRFWALPLPSSHAMFLSGYDASGRLIRRTSVDGNGVKLYEFP